MWRPKLDLIFWFPRYEFTNFTCHRLSAQRAVKYLKSIGRTRDAWHLDTCPVLGITDCVTSNNSVDVTRDEKEIKSLVTHQKNATCGSGIGLKYWVHRGKLLMEYFQFSFDKLYWISSHIFQCCPCRVHAHKNWGQQEVKRGFYDQEEFLKRLSSKRVVNFR